MTMSFTLAETQYANRHTNARRPILAKLGARLMTILMAASLVFASAVPSMADKRGDDLAKALAAALSLGASINGIDNNKPKPPAYNEPNYGGSGHGGKRLPSSCAIEIDSNRGRAVTVYSESCLRREGFNYRLPDCARSVRIYGKRDRVYSEQCLRDAGFRTRGRR